MWSKLAIGALVGLAVGHVAPPGYAVWIIAGTVAGYAADVWMGLANDRTREQIEL